MSGAFGYVFVIKYLIMSDTVGDLQWFFNRHGYLLE